MFVCKLYLFIRQAEFAEECFQRLLPTQLSLQLAIYYYALHIYVATTAINHLQPQSSQHPYCHSPADLVQHVTGYACQETNKDVAVAQHISQLKLYQEKLIDFGYARKLSQLDRCKLWDVIQYMYVLKQQIHMQFMWLQSHATF